MKTTSSRQRDPSMDVIRCFALLCLTSLHFFLYTDYTTLSIVGARMAVMTVLRSASYLSISLFMMLSGYLMHRCTPSARYYKKIGYTLSIYAMAALCCYCVRCFRESGSFLGGSVPQFLSELFFFTAAPYGWYIEMYIGLFLLIPYINGMFHQSSSQKDQLRLLLILVFLTSLPGVVNIFTLTPQGTLVFQQHTTQYQQIIPDWWYSLYPITFYIAGAYLREHPLKLSPGKSVLISLAAIAFVGGVNVALNYNTSSMVAPWKNEGSILYLIQAIPVFHTLSLLRDHIPPFLAKIFARLSPLCLGAYLVSWIFDTQFCGYVNQMEPVPAYRLNYYPASVLLSFVCSLALSAVLNGIYHLIRKLFSRKKEAQPV